jgi:hypothetical protein
VSWKTDIARRPLLASLAGLFGVAVAGGLAYEGVHVFGRRYPRTKFDDLLDQLPDRESAAKLGRAAIAQVQGRYPDFPARLADSNAVAHELRTRAGRGSVSGAVAADIAAGKLVEIQGWVLPVSLALIAVIAAETSGALG